jgi:CBS domain-containing protein
MIKRLCELASRLRRTTSSCVADEQGTALVEYAVVMAIVAGGIILTVDMMGSQTSCVFARLTAGSNGMTAATLSAKQTPDLPGLAEVASPITRQVGSWGQFAFSTLAIIVLVFALHSIRQSRRRDMLREKAADVAAIHRPARFVLKRQEMMRTLTNSLAQLVEGRLHVRHLMTQEVSTALPSASVAELTVSMAAQEVRHLLICDQDERLLGVVSDRDLRAPLGKTAEQIMTRSPITVAATTPIMIAVSMMLDRHFSSLPVVEGNRLVGILTTTDLAMALQCAMQLISQVSHTDGSEPTHAHPIASTRSITKSEPSRCNSSAADIVA